MTYEESDDRFYIAQSRMPGAGNGLFAKVPLQKSDQLIAAGVLIRRESIADRCTHFADEYKFRIGEHLLIPFGYAGMVNHSAELANLEKVVVGEQLILRTLRPISAGEELFFCYSEFAQKRFLSE